VLGVQVVLVSKNDILRLPFVFCLHMDAEGADQHFPLPAVNYSSLTLTDWDKL
jgi:hypothetical protein